MTRLTSNCRIANSLLQTLGGPFVDLSPLIADCHRFVLAYSPCIHAAPLQIYHCTLSIAPTNSLIASTYVHERKHALVVDHGSSSYWSSCLDAVSGHGGKTIFAVAYSQDGSFFVTAGWDGKATIWKTATRTPILSFGGHMGGLVCVACAPDGLHVGIGRQEGLCVAGVLGRVRLNLGGTHGLGPLCGVLGRRAPHPLRYPGG